MRMKDLASSGNFHTEQSQLVLLSAVPFSTHPDLHIGCSDVVEGALVLQPTNARLNKAVIVDWESH